MANGLYREFFHIASGWNNENGLVMLHQSNDCYFQSYKQYIELSWRDSEETVVTGLGRSKKIGPPMVVAKFPYWSLAEWKYFKSTFCSGIDNLVTVRLFNAGSSTWNNYNAILVLPKIDEIRKLEEFYEIELTFTKLRVL